jgi:hypothetical protein
MHCMYCMHSMKKEMSTVHKKNESTQSAILYYLYVLDKNQ